MKLIDLLVQELPKRGGWPQNALSITQDNDGSLCVWDTNDPHYEGFSWKHHTGNSLMHYWYGEEWATPLSSDHKESIVTYWQYKAALYASKKPAGNGEGLPPVGCECEWRDSNVGWLHVKIKYISEQIVVIESPTNLCGVQKLTETAKDIICDKPQFRPLRTEADKKRERICDAIYGALTMAERQHNRSDEAEAVYDAIAAGKIPGVKLDD